MSSLVRQSAAKLLVGGAIIGAIFIAVIWYASTQTTNTASESVAPSVVNEAVIEDHENALNDANQAIAEQNTCVNDALSLFENDFFDDGMDMLGTCQASEVPAP